MAEESCAVRRERGGYALFPEPKKPPGETAAAGVGAGGGAPPPATVTPVCTAWAAGMEERPGIKAPAAVVAMGALPRGSLPEPPAAAAAAYIQDGGLPEPQKQPGGAFIHWVTYAVTAEEQGEAAVTVT